MSSFVVSAVVVSGAFCILSFPQLFVGITQMLRMRRLQLPRKIFWFSTLSLCCAYLAMLTILMMSTFDDGPLVGIGISLTNLFFIMSKCSINILFLCRLHYSFKSTVFQYSKKTLLILLIIIIIECILYILSSDIIITHMTIDDKLKSIQQIGLTIYYCIDMVLRIVFICLFERGLYRLITARSFKSNLQLFGFGGRSIDKIELSCQPPSESSYINPRVPVLKDQTSLNSKNESNRDESDMHLSHQITDRSDIKGAIPISPIIPEGDENPQSFISEEESVETETNQDKNAINTKAKIKLPPSIQETDELPPEDILNLKNIITEIRISNDPKSSSIDTPCSIDTYSPRTVESEIDINFSSREKKVSNRKHHSRSSSQIDEMLNLSQLKQNNKRTSTFALKYFNDSTFDSHTKDLVNVVTKFSVLVVWSALISFIAVVYSLTFVMDWNDYRILQHVSWTHIILLMCFVEMHVVFLQLNGTEKWYKCLCGACHNAWGMCCVCKLRRRLVRKIQKQHNHMTIKAQQNVDT